MRWLAIAAVAVIAAVSAVAALTVSAGRGDVEWPSMVNADGGLDASGPDVADPANAQAVSGPTPVQLSLYTDYTDPDSARFASVNALVIQGLAQQGAVHISVYPLAVSDDAPEYEAAVRAGNAVACVAEFAQNDLWAFHVGLLAMQPSGETPSLQNADLNAIARDSGVHEIDDVTECIVDGRFSAWVETQSTSASDGGVTEQGIAIDRMPLVLANGDEYTGRVDNSTEFKAFVDARLGV
ncbi:MAG: DsbA family protein [Pseudoclavibacter sp.]